jgi:hypothetical protein
VQNPAEEIIDRYTEKSNLDVEIEKLLHSIDDSRVDGDSEAKVIFGAVKVIDVDEHTQPSESQGHEDAAVDRK